MMLCNAGTPQINPIEGGRVSEKIPQNGVFLFDVNDGWLAQA